MNMREAPVRREHNQAQSANYVESFEDLRVYGKAQEVAREIFQITQRFPSEERYALTSQIRRSSRSVGAQIEEARGKAPLPQAFRSQADRLRRREARNTALADGCPGLLLPFTVRLLSACPEARRNRLYAEPHAPDGRDVSDCARGSAGG